MENTLSFEYEADVETTFPRPKGCVFWLKAQQVLYGQTAYSFPLQFEESSSSKKKKCLPTNGIKASLTSVAIITGLFASIPAI